MNRAAGLSVALGCALAARAQQGEGFPSSVRGGVPGDPPSETPLRLTLDDAIARGLAHNLALALADRAVSERRGDRLSALGDLLPDLHAAIGESRQKINLAAYGFSLPGTPSLVGPFDVFDARLRATQPLLDLPSYHETRARGAAVDAARATWEDTRDVVVLVCGNLYLQAVAARSRIDAAEAEARTAETLRILAADREAAGTAAAIDLLRAEVEEANRRQALIAARNGFEKAKLALSRAIGLPLETAIELHDPVPFAEVVAPSPGDAVASALAARADVRAAQARVRSLEEERRAASAERLPRLELHADYGAIGPTLDSSETTYGVAAELSIPILARHASGKIAQADARLEAATAALADLRARVAYEVRSALLDVEAASERVDVARRTRDLAMEQLGQARDRFAAGVADNTEVVQAQQSVAMASEAAIESLYDHNVAKASLARAMGHAYEAYAAGAARP
ncbi:MAG: TolC family protein [Acidobacteriota bacterium]